MPETKGSHGPGGDLSLDRRTPDEVLERRTRVAKLMVTMDRPSIRRLAAQLNVSPSTIAKDVKAIRAEWKEDRLRDFEERLAEELAKVDLAEQEAWRAVAAAQQARTVRRRVTRPVIEEDEDGRARTVLRVVEEVDTTDPPGADMAALNAVLKCQERRAKLLGLDAPDRVDISGGGERVFAFTLKIGDTLVASQSNEADVLEQLKARPLPDGAAIIRVGPDGKHHPETTEPEDVPALEAEAKGSGNGSGKGSGNG